MVVFGIIAAATAFFHGRDSFFLLRVLLGAAEGGLYPGLILFLTYWIPTAYWVRVMGIFIFGAPLALIFGSPFTGLLLSFDGLWGLHGWQIMFLITGAATAAVGIWIQFYFDNAPAEARFLTPPARKFLVEELARNAHEREKFSPRGMLRMFVDWRVLYCIVVYFAIQVGIFAVVFYLPSLWGSLTGRRTGVISGLEIAIPWLVSILAIVLVTRIADRGTSKALLGFACLGLAGAGLFCGSLSSTPLIALCGFTIAAAGLMSVQPVFWSWPRAMLSGSAATAGIAFINALGNLGGFAAPNVKTWADVTARNSVAGLVTLSGITMAGALLLLGAGRMERLNPGS